MSRPYSNLQADAAIIAFEVLMHGQSIGWSGSVEDRCELERRLRKHNIHYTDDMSGTWKPTELGQLLVELDDDDVESITEFVDWLRS
jgi:hypothetical protein